VPANLGRRRLDSQSAHKFAKSGFAELAPFTFREAAFVLSRLASIEPGKPVGTDYADRVGISSRHE
jgi:hypothetical protein